MSVKSSVNSKRARSSWWKLIVLPIWVIVGYLAANLIVVEVLQAVNLIGVEFDSINESIFNLLIIAAVYTLALAIVVLGPLAIKSKVSSSTLGIDHWPTWRDIILSPVAYVIYMIIFVSVAAILMNYVPIIDFEQAQDVMFDNLNQRHEYLLAFIALVVVAPIAEEVLFRGYLYGRLRQSGAIWISALLTSVVFAGLHGQWNVAVDTFILSLVMCGLREYTGSIWAGTLLHMIKNGVAYFALFVSPVMFSFIL